VISLPSSAPIGVFDSGVGGLSILIEIRKTLPNEDLFYIADTAHCPYGVKPVEEIRKRVLDVSEYLMGLGAKAIVVACNSACVAGLDHIREVHPEIPIVGVEPAVKPAHDKTRSGKIGVLATDMTLSGERFSLLVEKYGTGIEVYTQPAPGLVELVEAGKLDGAETEQILKEYLVPMLEKGVDTLVLGCTHYPFLKPVIARLAGPDVAILDTGAAVARQTAKVLSQKQLLNEAPGPGRTFFYTTENPQEVSKVIGLLWNDPVDTVLKAEV